MGKKSKKKKATPRSTVERTRGSAAAAVAAAAMEATLEANAAYHQNNNQDNTFAFDTTCAVCQKELIVHDWTERDHGFMACCGRSVCKACQLGAEKAGDKKTRKFTKKVAANMHKGIEAMNDQLPLLADAFTTRNTCPVCKMFYPKTTEEHRSRIDQLATGNNPPHANAQFSKACWFANAGRIAEARPWYIKAARQGHQNACAAFGDLYMMGKDPRIGVDYVQAKQWYERAPDEAIALNGLGHVHRDGLGPGVAVDLERATELFRKSAEQGYPPGMLDYGSELYELGQKQEAEVWFEKCARSEHFRDGYIRAIANAQHNLATVILEKGQEQLTNNGDVYLPDQDPTPLVFFWLRRAELNGHAPSTGLMETIKNSGLLSRCGHCLKQEQDLLAATSGKRRLMICSGCKAAAYCSRDCQVQHYKEGHKVVCKGLPNLDEIPAENCCANCHVQSPPKFCQGCMEAQYCDEKCQTMHYPFHKKTCREIRRCREAEETS